MSDRSGGFRIGTNPMFNKNSENGNRNSVNSFNSFVYITKGSKESTLFNAESSENGSIVNTES